MKYIFGVLFLLVFFQSNIAAAKDNSLLTCFVHGYKYVFYGEEWIWVIISNGIVVRHKTKNIKYEFKWTPCVSRIEN